MNEVLDSLWLKTKIANKPPKAPPIVLFQEFFFYFLGLKIYQNQKVKN